METFDLSNSQKQILNSENISNNSLKFKYSLPLNLEEYIDEALDLLINNYLNLQITQEEDSFKQYITPQIQGNYIFKDLSNNKKEDEVINEFLSQDFKDYLNVPLYKFLIIKTNKNIEIIGNIHSLLSDIGSITQLYDYFNDIITSLKSDKEYESDSNIFSYKKFIDSFNDYSSSKSYEEDVQFYLNQFNDISAYVDRLSLIKEFSFDKKVLKLNDKLITNIQKLLKEKGDISKLTFFTSILSIYLGRTSNSQGTIFKTYYYTDYENIVPVKIPYNKFETFNETLNNNQKIFEDYYAHANISFNDYSNLLNNQIDNSLLLYYSIREIPHMEGVEFLSYGDNKDSALSIIINNWDLEFQYNTSKFASVEIEHLIGNLESLLENILDDTSKSLDDYDIISDEEKSLIEEYSKGKTLPFDHSKILTDYVTYYAQKTPDNYAIEDKDSKITYKQLDEDISSLSYQLINNEGIGKGDIVAVMLPRLYSFPLTFLSIMKVGATFVYIDQEYPLERINFILNTTQAKFLITTKSDYDLSQLEIDNIRFVEDYDLSIKGEFEVKVNPDDLAFLIFTSGSTGTPKGVEISHLAFMEFVVGYCELCNFETGELILGFSSFGFIASYHMFGGLYKGLSCKILDEDIKKNIPKLVDYFKNTEINSIVFPSNFGLQLHQENDFKIKNLIVGGEKLPNFINKKFTPHNSNLINGYGASETCAGVLYFDMDFNRFYDNIPVGKPGANVWAYILDDENRKLPIGVAGEIVISGKQLSNGYWKNEDLTNKSFEINPYSTCEDNKIMYHTGDLGYWNFYGEIEVIGRVDNQIKLHGFRIEPGEIEKIINDNIGIKSSVVMIRNDNLVAYYTAEKPIDKELLNERISAKVPEYMVPSYYVEMEAFPLNNSGKVDRKQLPDPEIVLTDYIKPETEMEKSIFDICSEILGANNFGVDTNLLSLGLNSLSAIKVSYQISKKYKVSISVKDITEAKNIKGIINKIESSSTIEESHNKKLRLYPLSQNQLGVYFECIKDPQKLIYNIPLIANLGSKIDAEKLKDCIISLVNKHPYLKSIVFQDGDEIYIKRQDDADVTVNVFNQELTNEIKNNFVKPFDLFKGPLYRFHIYNTKDNVYLLMDVHHIIFDGTSANIFVNELIDEYNGVNTHEEPFTGFDFILDELKMEKSEKYETAKKYFQKQLSKIDTVTSIIPDVNGKKEEGILKEASAKINKEETFKFCKNNSITPNNLFLASTLLVLSKFTYNNKILLSTISNGRVNPNFHDTLAMIVRSLPIVNEINSDLTIQEFLDYVQKGFMDTIDNECYPFTKVFEQYDMLPELYYAYQVGLLTNNSINNGDGGENTVTIEALDLEVPKFNVCVYIEEDPENILINIRYNDKLYTQNLMNKLANSIQLMVNKFQESLELKVNQLNLLTSSEEEECTDNEVNFKIKEYEPLLNKTFENIVNTKGDDLALIATDTSLTYNELNTKANIVAHNLISKGVNVNDKVILKLKRDSKLIIALLAVVKAGASFIPLDPEYPSERIEYILKDSDGKFIISNQEQDTSKHILNIDDLLNTNNCEDNPTPDLKADDVAFLIYTSGSTGRPKGVMIKHSGITNYINPVKENTPIYAIVNKVSKMLSITTVSFIAFLREILAPIVNGVPVVLANEEESINPIKLAELISETGADGLSGTPSRLQQYLEVEEFKKVLKTIKVMTIGGEKFPQSLIPQLKDVTSAEIYNSYGPTEVTIASHGKLITENIVSEGKPLYNVIDLIVDLDNNPLPTNIVGSICVGGAGVSKGYYNNPELNEKSYFIRNGVRYYNTGDLGYKDENGELFVAGRSDAQIKLRGLRIEIGEIESVIMENPQINNVCVSVKTVDSIEYLCAYYTSKQKINSEELRESISQKLTDYMVPTFFIHMDKFPLNPNGKLDMKKLPLPKVTDNEDLIPPETELEKLIFEICSEVIGNDKFGITTNLFHMGLTSLSVIKVISLISKKIGVTLNVADLMRGKTVKSICEEVKKAENDKEDSVNYSKRKYYPLTQNQLGVYFDIAKNTETTKYNLPKIIHFKKSVNPETLKKAIVLSINHHPYLKTVFKMDKGELIQVRQDDLDITDNILIKHEEVTEDISKEFIKPFDLLTGPLFRFEIYDCENETVLLSDFNHMIVDGGSLNILFNYIAQTYDKLEEGESLNEPLSIEEDKTGFEYSLDDNNIFNSDLYSEAEEYFKFKVEDFDESTILTPDLNGVEEDGEVGAFILSVDKDKVDNYCKDNAITPNNLFLSATSLNLAKFTGDKNILISTISNGRGDPSYENTLAMMVKTLALPLNINTNQPVTDYFNYCEDVWLDIMKYNCYPFTKISNDYNIYPEFLFAFHGKIIEDIQMQNTSYQRESLGLEGLKFKLAVNVVDTGEEYQFKVEYNDALYSPEFVKLFVENIKVVLSKFIENPNKFLKDISLIDVEEAVNAFEVRPIPIETLDKLFEAQVEKTPDNLALISVDGDFTYAELNRKANRIANSLISRGIGVEDKVMLILKRDSNFFASLLGVWKAGAAYIPVDPEYPLDRIRYYIEDSEAKMTIVNPDYRNMEDDFILIDDLLENDNTDNPNVDVSPNNLAYIIYTSGSTGQPKGVLIEHKSFCNQCSLENKHLQDMVSEVERYVSITTVAFDAFLECIKPLMHGKTIVFASEEQTKDPLLLTKLFKETNGDLFHGTPSRLLEYLKFDQFREVIEKCKIIIVGGEGVQKHLIQELKEITDAKIYNGYGPTETTLASNFGLLTGDKITVGPALYNYHELIVDMDGGILSDTVVGELLIGGEGLFRGYLNKEEKTQEAIIEIDGKPYYKSGDHAKRELNGDYTILGRLDNQIKLRGLRIEIGEVEAALMEYPEIKDIIVLVKKVQNNDHLCAYYTSEKEINTNKLKKFVSNKLTPYMIPTIYTHLNEIPLTPNGKKDLKNLPEPELIMDYVAPQNSIENFFCETFKKVLNIDQVGVTNNFFEIGGTSLIVTSVTVEAMKEGYDLSYGDVFDNPTPKALAKLVTKSEHLESDEDIRIEAKHDYTEINKLLEKNNLESFIKGEKTELGNVLLTGATGFLGIHVLRELIESETGKIYCFMRKGRRTSPEDRLKVLLFYYFSNNYEELFGKRIFVIPGDITNMEDFDNLLYTDIDTVFNCAASVKHFAAGTQIEDINVGGVAHGLEFARKKGAKFIQISTASVGGESLNGFPTPDTTFDEQTLYIGQVLDNKYLSSKFEAERLTLQAAAEGVEAKVLRAGNLMARNADGEFQINYETNSFIQRLKAFGALGKMPYSAMGIPVEFTPIDLSAKAMVMLAKTPKECVLFNSYDNHYVYLGDIMEIMNENGFNIKGVEADEFKEALDAALMDEENSEKVSGLMTNIGMGSKDNREMVHVSNNKTIQILYRLGFKWDLVSEDYVEMFLKYLIDMRFFEE